MPSFVLLNQNTTISPHKCQFFKKKIVYMGLEFQVDDSKVCYTPLKDKCDAIRNLDSPDIETDESILWHGQFSVIIFTRLKETTYTHI